MSRKYDYIVWRVSGRWNLRWLSMRKGGCVGCNYSNVGHDLYATVITSTYNKFTDCTISWTGTGTDGKPNSGAHGYVLPPYYGHGTAITSRANFNLIYMNATAICSPRN